MHINTKDIDVDIPGFHPIAVAKVYWHLRKIKPDPQAVEILITQARAAGLKVFTRVVSDDTDAETELTLSGAERLCKECDGPIYGTSFNVHDSCRRYPD